MVRVTAWWRDQISNYANSFSQQVLVFTLISPRRRSHDARTLNANWRIDGTKSPQNDPKNGNFHEPVERCGGEKKGRWAFISFPSTTWNAITSSTDRLFMHSWILSDFLSSRVDVSSSSLHRHFRSVSLTYKNIVFASFCTFFSAVSYFRSPCAASRNVVECVNVPLLV